MLNTCKFIAENAGLNIIEALEKVYRLGQKDERRKVNKAIEEIRKISPTPTAEDVVDGNPKKEAIWAVLIEVEKILKMNLGD